MPSGFRLDTDTWLKQYDEAKTIAQDVVQTIQDRNLHNADGGPEASRKTAFARRRLGLLGTEIEKLLQWLDSPEAGAKLSEAEVFRRRDLVHGLRNRREQILTSIKRYNQIGRDALIDGTEAAGSRPKETEATAEVDNRGLLQMHDRIMKQQDEELESIEKSVHNTKQVAVTIGEEVDLHTRLLEDLDEDVEVTHSRMRAATKRVKYILAHSSNLKGGMIIFLLIVGLVLVILVAFKVLRIFAAF